MRKHQIEFFEGKIFEITYDNIDPNGYPIMVEIQDTNDLEERYNVPILYNQQREDT